ncbi:DnaJ domain, zinc finger, CCHC-type, tetratricopeptide-like helical domain protein [Tanacetum coccineum]
MACVSSCHVVLGEIDEALCCYNKCLDSNMAHYDKSLNREASNGLKNAKKVANNIKQSAELLQLKTFESSTNGMEIVTEALTEEPSLYSAANVHAPLQIKHAYLDLKRLISIREKRSEKKNVEELELFRQHLSTLERLMNEGIPMDLYNILGLKGSESDIEFKKAYDKAAHIPDKAGMFLAICKCGADSHIWKEIKKTIHMDADKLFKKIGEAYVVLSGDSNKVCSLIHEFKLLFGYIVPLIPYYII